MKRKIKEERNKTMNNEKENLSVSEKKPYSGTTRSKGSKYGKFNVVDFFLLLVILAMIAAVVVYVVPGISEKLTPGRSSEIAFSIEFKGVDSAFITNIKVGDTVYDAGKNFVLGEVKSVENYASTVLVYDKESGVGVMKEMGDLKNVIVTVRASAAYTDHEGYAINGERIAVGCPYSIRFPQFSGEGYCIEVSASAK